jgi:hypothetical protein
MGAAHEVKCLPRLQAASCVMLVPCGSHVAAVFIFYGYVTPRKGDCFVASETKSAHTHSGSVIVSLSAVAVHRTPAQAGIFLGGEDGLHREASKPRVVYRMTFRNWLQGLSNVTAIPYEDSNIPAYSSWSSWTVRCSSTEGRKG